MAQSTLDIRMVFVLVAVLVVILLVVLYSKGCSGRDGRDGEHGRHGCDGEVCIRSLGVAQATNIISQTDLSRNVDPVLAVVGPVPVSAVPALYNITPNTLIVNDMCTAPTFTTAVVAVPVLSAQTSYRVGLPAGTYTLDFDALATLSAVPDLQAPVIVPFPVEKVVVRTYASATALESTGVDVAIPSFLASDPWVHGLHVLKSATPVWFSVFIYDYNLPDFATINTPIDVVRVPTTPAVIVNLLIEKTA
jgi:hypothetical protein